MLVAAVVVAVAGTVWFLDQDPWSQGGSSGPANDPRFSHSVSDPFGSGTAYVYCYAPDSTLTWYVSLRNNGPVPVTLMGVVPAAPDMFVGGNATGLVEIAAARQALPIGTPIISHDYTDPRTEPSLAPTIVQPDDEIDLWARYRTGSADLPEGSGMTIRSLDVRYSVFGIERSRRVDLRDGIQIDGPPCIHTVFPLASPAP